MCCNTHNERDSEDKRRGIEFTLATSEHFRCQCTFGVLCERQQAGPELLCEWCRDKSHEKACGEFNDRYVREYERALFEQQRNPFRIEQYANPYERVSRRIAMGLKPESDELEFRFSDGG